MDPSDIEFDEFCDPNNPRKIKYEDVLAAHKRIAGTIIKTDCPRAHMSDIIGVELYMKQEFLQYTGSFKERGVRNTLMTLTDEQRKIGAVAASAGNHGMAMSHHTTQMGIPGIVVLPIYTPLGKVSRCERLGAKVILHGTNIAQAKHHAMALSKEKKMPYVNGFDHPKVVEGQGTIGIEIMEQVPNVDAVLLPCGGGSMLAGVATAVKYLKPEIEVYGIETNTTASMSEALKKNERVFINIESTIADGLAVNMVGVNTFHTVKSGVVDKVIVVDEDWVARAVTMVLEHEKYVVEGAGCVGVAAILAGLLPNLKGKTVVSVFSGGNIVPSVLSHVIERGLTKDGRLFRFRVVISDRPGGLAELVNMMSSIGIALRDIVPERTWVKGDICSVEMKVVAESKGWDHTKEMLENIKKNFKEYYFEDMQEQLSDKVAIRRGPCLAPHPACMKK